MAKKKDAAASPAVPPEEIPALSGEQSTKVPQGAQEAAQTLPSTEVAPMPVRAVVQAENGLNLRAGPGSGFEAHEALPDGMEVSVLTLLAEGAPQGIFDFRVPGWRYVFTGEKVGWVDARFLKLLEAAHGQS